MVRLSPLLLIISLCVVLNAASVAQRLHNHPYFVGQSYLGGMTPLIQENSILDYTKQDLQWLARFPMDKLYQYQNRGWVGGRRK